MTVSMASELESLRDMLTVALATAAAHVIETIADMSDSEYHWEPLSGSERLTDLALTPDRKKVWRVYQHKGAWRYDYTREALHPSPFVTIAWIMNHVAQAGDMYLHCVKTGKPEGVDRNWDDLPVCGTRDRQVGISLRS